MSENLMFLSSLFRYHVSFIFNFSVPSDEWELGLDVATWAQFLPREKQLKASESSTSTSPAMTD